MGQAKARKNTAAYRAMIVEKCQQSVQATHDMMELVMEQNLAPELMMERVNKVEEEGMLKVVRLCIALVESKRMSITEMHDAVWRGYNGLLQADCVRANVQACLGMSVSKPDVNDYVVIGG